jgi:hypothetical protein
MGSDGGGENRESVARLLAAGFDHAEHPFDKAAAGGADGRRLLRDQHQAAGRSLAALFARPRTHNSTAGVGGVVGNATTQTWLASTVYGIARATSE